MTREDMQRGKSPGSEYIKQQLEDWESRGKDQILETFKTRLKNLATLCKGNNWPESSLGPIELDITATNEVAYQRAFFNASTSEITNLINCSSESITITWLDLEVPVVADSTRKFDLIGMMDNDFVIAEIKCLPSGEWGESPLYAMLEGLEYAILAKKARKEEGALRLRCHSNAKTAENYWSNYQDCKYIVIGTTISHWNKISDNGKCWRDHIGKLEQIAKWVKDQFGYIVLFVEFSDEDFERQKKESQENTYLSKKENQEHAYLPKLEKNPDSIWKQVKE